jgi:hypothetical protein
MSGLWLSRQQGLVDLSELRTKSIAGNSAPHRMARSRLARTNICGNYRRCIECGLIPVETIITLRAMFDVGYFSPSTPPRE